MHGGKQANSILDDPLFLAVNTIPNTLAAVMASCQKFHKNLQPEIKVTLQDNGFYPIVLLH